MELSDIKFDCIYFKGHIPCEPNKQNESVCDNCKDYIKIEKRILIIKLGAIGDVIRTTPLIVKYKKKYPNAHFTWLTLSPDVLPKDQIHVIYKYNHTAVFNILHQQFDIAINLDKEIEACALLSDVNADEKYGFIWKNNHIDIATNNAEHKLITGLFDSISIKNTKHYLDEIFEICHLDFNDEPYLLNFNSKIAEKWKAIFEEKAQKKVIVGLNTGCGKRWQTRLWPNNHWIAYINLLHKNNYFPVLLGGADEDANNQFIANETNTYYPGHFSLEEFISLTSNCDIIVTQVSMMMHIATALQKKLVLMNNIFNKNEYYLYNRGKIIEPETGCDCYYGITCLRDIPCMNDLKPASVFEITKQLT
ncbi:MAG: glycosyltransferase family 9 protein [Chlorobi bacterium]|nr:glycosyltransferase family 9 protein [Chlorobiota bacterium]